MDPVTVAVGAITTFLLTKGAEKAGEKAAEVVGEKSGEALVGVGARAWETIASWFQRKNDSKAQRALNNIAEEPDDEAYQTKLINEIRRLTNEDPEFAAELQKLVKQVEETPNGISLAQSVVNSSYVAQAANQSKASVNINTSRNDS
jgi:hypothetical protein